MNCRLIEPKDHETAKVWWVKRGWDGAVPFEDLPPTGKIIEGICMGWIYISNGNIAHLTWVIGNPDVKGDEMRNGVLLLIKELIILAKENNNNKIFMSTKNESLIKISESAGFTICENEVTNSIYF